MGTLGVKDQFLYYTQPKRENFYSAFVPLYIFDILRHHVSMIHTQILGRKSLLTQRSLKAGV